MLFWAETAYCVSCGRPIYRHHYFELPDGTVKRWWVEHIPDTTCV